MTEQNQPKVILIDDEADIRHLLTMTLVQMKLDVVSCKDLGEAKKALNNEQFDFCLTDLKLPDGDGLEMVDYCKKNYPNMPIAVITAYSSTEKAIEAMKLGAFDFLSKPIDLSHLRQLLKHAFKFNQKKKDSQQGNLYKVLVGDDKQVSELRHQISKIKGSQAPVVIEGEAGTEKEALAQIIHQQSSRLEAQPILLDFAAHDPDTHEAILFAHNDKVENYLSRANNSTLIISNIQLMSKPLQKRFLQCIEEKSMLMDSSYGSDALDVRLIICSEKPFNSYVKQQILREDLYFRLDVINLSLPKLSSRKDDLVLIVNSYLQEFKTTKTLSSSALQKLLDHDFPYNYRELENILFKAATLAEGEQIGEQDLIVVKTPSEKNKNTNVDINLRGNTPLDEYLEQIEKNEIKKALDKTRWNRTEAAKLLKISFRTIRYKMKKLNIT